MGLFDFLKKKKEDEFGAGFGEDMGFGAETGMPGIPGSPGMAEIPPARPGAVPGTPGRGQLFGAPEPAQMQPPPMSPTSISFGQPQQMSAGPDIASKIEVLNSKIDSLRISVERVNDRLEFLERYLRGR